MIKRIAGLAVLLIGVLILGWIGYNYLVEMQPEAKGRNPIGALLFSCAAIYVGGRWLLGNRQNKT